MCQFIQLGWEDWEWSSVGHIFCAGDNLWTGWSTVDGKAWRWLSFFIIIYCTLSFGLLGRNCRTYRCMEFICSCRRTSSVHFYIIVLSLAILIFDVLIKIWRRQRFRSWRCVSCRRWRSCCRQLCVNHFWRCGTRRRSRRSRSCNWRCCPHQQHASRAPGNSDGQFAKPTKRQHSDYTKTQVSQMAFRLA